ncbi:MAG: hypothetical protein WC346_06770 [Methanogenium sp.]
MITNSSTELFIANDAKEVEVVKNILEKMLEISNLDSNGNVVMSHKVDEIFNVYKIDEKNVDSLIEMLDGYSCNQNREELIGKIIIEGTSDNVIPYELFELIERKFDAERIHLG